MNPIAKQILDGLIPGIVSGLVTSLVVFCFLQYWSRVFIPWFEQRLYRGIHLDDTWDVSTDSPDPFKGEVKLSQSAHRVHGSIEAEESGALLRYEFEGEFRDLILTASYRQIDSKTLDRGTFSLLCTNNGNSLIGCFAWYDNDSNKIVSGKYQWHRRTARANAS